MKKLVKYMLLALAILTTSCSDFLEEKPKSFLSPDNYYNTYEDVTTALNALYRTPQDRYSRMWASPCWFEWGTDLMEITEKSTWAHHKALAYLPSTFDADASIPLDFWKHTYNHLKDGNNLLKALPKVLMTDDQRKLVEGQARALRAFIYFDAVRVFNGVPLILESSTDMDYFRKIPRAEPLKVYEAIVEDLKFAIEALPQKWDKPQDGGRITSGAAAAMLANVYLTMAGYPLNQTDKYAEAAQLLKEFVVDKKYGSHYKLLPEYSFVFDNAKGPGDEGVWIINFTRGTFGNGSQWHTEFAPLELYYAKGIGLTYGGGWSNGLPTDKFYNSYDKINDKRFKHSYWSSTAEIAEEYDALLPQVGGVTQHISFYRPHIKKFREVAPNNNSEGSGLNHSVIRYAEVLLMYAEVLNELGDAKCYNYINQVRNRAGLSDLEVMTKDQFREHLMLERAWELCFEGNRKFDLLRWGNYITRTESWNPQVKGNIKANKHEFWPIPQTERDVNSNLTQNPNW